MILIWSLYPAVTSSLTFKLWKHVLWRISFKRHCLIAHTIAQKTSKEAPRGSFIKVRNHSDEEHSLIRLKYASEETRWTPASQTSQWWYHTTNPLFWGRGQSSRMSNSSATSWWKYLSYSPPAVHCKKRVSKHEATVTDQNEDSKTSRIVVESHPSP